MENVLICGAGVAGSTLAYWLARNGFKVTVVERAQGMRSSGNPVDVRGPALPVVEAMGVVRRLRDVATRTKRVRLLGGDGRRIATVGLPAVKGEELEVPRSDLVTVLYEAARGEAEFLFDDTIAGLRQDEHGVDVTFDRAAPRHFDLVIGADGLHSAVRRLTFGPERSFVRPTGIYVATTSFGGPVDHPEEVLLHNTPGRLVAIHPSRDEGGVAFIFRARVANVDYRDTARHKRIVTAAYGDVGWRVPALLERLRDAEDVFFDAVSVVDLPSWSRGRIALVGDAASCVSLLGEGSSLAIAGAHTLATALAAAPSAGFGRYEAEHRARVMPARRAAKFTAAMLVPKTKLGLATRNLAARAWPWSV
ncbi:FAD-dependent oxidoreductase [Amycolatopsis decaplanina]|uniref:Monooxygenase FAD-binding protein n=1 Tax=Amycolatopsis decaplanina DSM 44594 TaxID=1284240 RepID=M2YSC1_9PSEU|nr:FAD-dependent oxidoreductase [Amycolatopsis decaplanina]EME51209.1 monooxygenase FAD-binding protein [Amycolatopsis decaplanina DSM 44594]